jgi:hypothetical protein
MTAPKRVPWHFVLVAGRPPEGGSRVDRIRYERRVLVRYFGVLVVLFWVATVVFLPPVALIVPLIVTLLFGDLVRRVNGVVRRAERKPDDY